MRLKLVRAGESGNGAGAKMTPWQRSYTALAASGWLGVHERMGSKYRGAMEWMGGEPKVVE